MKYYARQFKTKDEKCIVKSKEWITNHSRLPDTYVPIRFTWHEETRLVKSNGIIMKTVPDTKCYSIIHKYMVQDNNDERKICYSKFIFDPQYKLKNMYYSFSDSINFSEENDTLEWKKVFGIK